MKKATIIALITASIASTLYVNGQPASVSEIEQMQNSYYKKNGQFLQVLKQNKTPHYKTDKLPKKIPDNMEIVVYETPNKKKGYQIFYEDDNNFYSIGYGPEAQSRTFTTKKKIITQIASSTPQ